MKKLLFIVNQGEISSNSSGGSSVYFSHLECLWQAGFEIELLAVQWSDKTTFKPEDYCQIRQFVSVIEPYVIQRTKKVNFFLHWYRAIFKPELSEYSFLNDDNIIFLKDFIKKRKVELIFADWRWSAIWAIFSKLSVPVVYGHHDWEYKLAKLRKKFTIIDTFHNFQKKRVEFALVRKATLCVSGSYTEAVEIEKISKKKVLYIPTTYKLIEPQLQAFEVPNLVHLGGMGTTANRLGLERFLEACWIEIQQKQPSIKLIVIGDLSQAPETLIKKLNDPNILCTGFVPDLQTVLHPRDIHIIPWQYNTGTRTRIPVVLNYEQVLVTTKEAALCFPEITENNSVLCQDLKEMTKEILNLYSDRERLHLLSKKGKELFSEVFTTDRQVEKMKQLDQLV